ncbi:hypothetical protein K4F52_006094 [Lecanicillium sp. MT-2017a]|nr:hypothetical protein K4F52_006094 [Lecanicillium sp. MT-2017a]
MTSPFRLLALLLAVLPFASALALGPKPLPPPQDPFYTPPEGFESAEPGTILRQRKVHAALFGGIPDPIETHQLLYRTVAIDGSPIATVTTVFKPLFAKKDRFVAFATAYDSSAKGCTPSYTYQLGSKQDDLISAAEYIVLQGYVHAGYIVASPDYEGPDTAFAAGRLAGMGVLDSMRAVVNFRETLGLEENARIVGNGYSGGAIATGWAASLQPTYAPELSMSGWSIGGTPANLTSLLNFLDGSIFSGFLPGAFAGIIQPSAYGGEIKSLLNEALTPYGQEILQAGLSNCAPQNVIKYPYLSVFSTKVQKYGPELAKNPTFKMVISASVMGVNKTETPTAPVYLYHAKDDEIIPYDAGETLFKNWCGFGAKVKFDTYEKGGHITTEALALLQLLKYAEAAFDGQGPTECSTGTQLDNALNPLALGAGLEPVLTKLLEVLTAAGKKDRYIVSNVKVLNTPIDAKVQWSRN